MKTQELRDIADKAVSNEPLETVDPSQTPDVEEPTQAPDQSTDEEIKPFAEKGDLSGKTPEELEEIHANWNKAYTQKRQAETKELKELRAKLAQYEQGQQKPESQPTQQPTQKADRPSLEDVLVAFREGKIDQSQLTLYLESLRDQEKEEMRELIKQEAAEQTRVVQEQAYQEKAIESFYAADERLNENSPNFDSKMQSAIGNEMANLLDVYIEEHGTSLGFDYKSETQRLINEYDEWLDGIVAKRVKQSTTMAKARAAKANKTQVAGSSTPVIEGQSPDIRKLLDAAL